MAYTNIDLPTDYFNTILYTGTGSARTITGVGFQPDWVWIKERSASASDHNLSDAVRGAGKALFSNTTGAEFDYGTGTGGNLRSFDSDGFSLGTASQTNVNGTTFVSWCWKANGTGVSNTSGTISSTVSANTTSGFSIVSYSGNGTGGATVGHGLGSALGLIILKCRGTAGTSWQMFHKSLGATKSINLEDTAAAFASTAYWNDTAPTSSVFTLGTGGDFNNGSRTYIAYCFAEVKGFSKFGTYSGNSSTNGPMVYLGFKPSFLLIKHFNGAGNEWEIYDNKRIGYNPANYHLNAHDNTAEATLSNRIDFLSNGFKLRAGPSGPINSTGNNYIYMAFAESPFVSSSEIPTTAR